MPIIACNATMTAWYLHNCE